MKVCFFGLGSIGMRHLNNFTEILDIKKIDYEIHAYRSSKKPIPSSTEKKVERQIYKKQDLEKYDLVFVTNPTSLHYKIIKENIEHTQHMFIEKPLFSSTRNKLTQLNLKKNANYYIACPLRFHPIIDYIKSAINFDDLYAVRSICSSYLPEWRDSGDYRRLYSARKKMGGGVSRDLIHEIDYLTYLFGMPKKIANIRGKYSDLEIDSDDFSSYILNYSHMAAEIHLDYFGRVPQRKIDLFLRDEVVTGNFLDNTISYLTKNKKVSLSKNSDMYRSEMEYFIDCILNNKKTHNEIEKAYEILALSEGNIL